MKIEECLLNGQKKLRSRFVKSRIFELVRIEAYICSYMCEITWETMCYMLCFVVIIQTTELLKSSNELFLSFLKPLRLKTFQV